MILTQGRDRLRLATVVEAGGPELESAEVDHTPIRRPTGACSTVQVVV